jgi:gluconate 2-dehydrogenase gamma chain
VNDARRRRFLLCGTALGGASLACPWLVRATAPLALSPLPVPVRGNNFAYLNAAEVDFLNAALDRLIPSDALGPGAREAGVVVFIDRQLAGDYGRASQSYMQGPFASGTPSQGNQIEMTPAVLYRSLIEKIDAHCQTQFGKRFAALAGGAQDELLHAAEKGTLALDGVPIQHFFQVLWQNTQEGYFADPLYGGNQGFAGWMLVGYPGPRYNYIDQIEQYGVRYSQPTVGLMGRNARREPQS